MSNQYTTKRYDFYPVKFSVRFPPVEADELSKTAAAVGLDKATCLRTLAKFAARLVEDFRRDNPAGARMVTLEELLKVHYSVRAVVLQVERDKAYERMRTYQAARAADGETIDFRLNSRALDFYLGAWARGLSVKELLAEFHQTGKLQEYASGAPEVMIERPAVVISPALAIDEDEDELAPVVARRPAGADPRQLDPEFLFNLACVLAWVVVALAAVVVGLLLWYRPGC